MENVRATEREYVSDMSLQFRNFHKFCTRMARGRVAYRMVLELCTITSR